jgi:hypothetical protein
MQFMQKTWTGWSCFVPFVTEPIALPGISNVDSPNTIAHCGGYGVDADHNGIADPQNVNDAMASASKYLVALHAKTGSWKQAFHNYNGSGTAADKYASKAMLRFKSLGDLSQ